jgi:hypothetical protein
MTIRLRPVFLGGLLALSAALSAAVLAQPPASEAPAPLSAAELDALEPAVDVSEPSSRSTVVSKAPPSPPSGPGRAVDSLDLGTTSITGNQELPKVLYIVPWKQSDLGDLVGRPANTLLDEVLAPVDPEVFERQLGYYETLHAENEEE